MDAVVDVEAALTASLAALAASGLGPGTPVLVAVSGGQDSLCLLHALVRARQQHGWRLRVACVDHHLRPAATDEAARVVALAADLGLPAAALSADVPTYRQRTRLNVQAAARYARYQTLAGHATAIGASAVLVGHTADDVAETLLLHLLRGAGLDGLAALPLLQHLPRAALGPPLGEIGPLPDTLPLARPLRTIARATTGAYCQAVGLMPFGEPPGKYRRDRLRAELLPALETHQPGARRALVRAAAALADERAALEQTVDRLWAETARLEDDRIWLSLAAWQAQPSALRKRLLRRAVATLAGTAADLSARALDAALALADRQSGRALALPHGLRLRRERGALLLTRRRPPAALDGEWRLLVPGEVHVPGLGRLIATRASAPPPGWPPATAPECWLNAAALGDTLVVRTRRPGDRFQPLGLGVAKRLQDFLVDAHVPREMRARLPLVVGAGGIAWAIGWRIADWARVRTDSTRLLHLRFLADDDGGAECDRTATPGNAQSKRTINW